MKQTKSDDDYDGAKIPVEMRLTIDACDEYDFLGVDPYPGDSVSDEDWMHGALQPGMSYGFTYTMALDPAGTGWKTRTVTAKLHNRSRDTDEVESCAVRPPWVPAKVTLEDPNAHIINDNMSYLYLAIDGYKFNNGTYPNAIVNLPIKVDSDGNTTIHDVRLNTIEQLNGVDVSAWGGDVRKSMEPGEAFDMWSMIQIRGTQEEHLNGYKLVMYLTGTIVNRKGKQEQIKSLPVEVPLVVHDRAESKKTLALTVQKAPVKSGYYVNDEVEIRLTAQNNTDTRLLYTRIESLGPSNAFNDQLDCGHGVKGWQCAGTTGVAPGDSQVFDVPVTIPASCVGKGIYIAQWVVEADLQDGSGTVCSNIATLKLPVKPEDEKLGLELTSHSPELE